MLEKLDIAVINLDRRPDRMAYIYKHIPFLFRPMTFDISGFNMPGWDSVGGGAGGGGFFHGFFVVGAGGKGEAGHDGQGGQQAEAQGFHGLEAI